MAFERQSVGTNSNLSSSQARGMLSLATSPAMRIIGTLAVVFLTGSSAFGQFLVNPATIRATVFPGRSDMLSASINSLMEERQAVGLRLVDLAQGSDGAWRVIEPDDSTFDRTGLKSCRSWLTLVDNTVTLEPSQMVPLRVNVSVPRGEWGYYFAAIVATPRPREMTDVGPMGAPINMSMVVPIVIQVKARALRCKVSLADLGLHYQRLSEDTVPATMVHMMVKNEGTTFSRLQGVTRISRKVGGYWRRVTEVQFPPQGDQGIIPGALLDLALDVGQPLPPGEYKIEGFLAVDGRRADQIEKTVTFEGDPRAARDVVEGTTLDLDPFEVSTRTAPGRTRFDSILVVNASEQQVSVDVSAALPEQMAAKALGWTRQGQTVGGPHFDCSPWLTFEPAQFTLDGYGRQTVRIQCDIPKTAVPLAQYFATLKFHARFPNGQDAGTTRGRLYLENSETEPTVSTRIRQVRLGLLDAPNYTVTADCVNLGDARFLPRCRCAIRTTGPVTEQTNVLEFEMVSDVYGDEKRYGPMLPMEARTFTGILNIASLAPGTYRRIVQFENDLGGEPVQDQDAFEVVEENGAKSIVERDLADIGVIEIRL